MRESQRPGFFVITGESGVHFTDAAKLHDYQIGERVRRSDFCPLAPIDPHAGTLQDRDDFLLHLLEGLIRMRAGELVNHRYRCTCSLRRDGGTVGTTECETDQPCGDRAHDSNGSTTT